MTYRVLLLLLCCGTFARGADSAATPEKKNVVFILADDLGWSDTTLYGTTRFYETPNLERLAKRGMTFDRAYAASPLCSPTRSAILTGLSPARTGLTTPNCHLPQVVLQASVGTKAPSNLKSIQPNPTTRLATEYRTLAETLKDEGYATGHFGKWHLGPEPYSPLQQGFDVDLPHTAGPGPAGSYVAPWKFKDFDADPDVPDQHIEDRMAKEAVAFMKQHQDGPFFLNYWMFSVHAPFDAKADLIEKHRLRVDPNDPQRSPTYAAMVESMDAAVGTLLDTLDELGLAEKTIVIFTSDNGGNMYNEVDGTTPTSNVPLKGGKATMFEGGTRVPCVIAWPGLTYPGSRSSELIQSEDFYPTLLAGLRISAAPGQEFDGFDVRNALTGGTLKRSAVFQYFPHNPPVPDWLPPSVSVHSGDMKLIRLFHGGEKGAHRYLLYDLKNDIGETTNLAAEKPELVKELDGLIEAFLTDSEAVRPVPNPAFDPAAYRPELEGKAVPKKSKAKDAPASAWQASPKSRLEKKGEVTVLSSEGNDPWMSTSRIPAGAKGPFRVELRLQSPSKGPAMIYFRAVAKDAFHKAQTVSFQTAGDAEIHDYALDLPCKTLHSLRLDPAPGAGEFRFGAIRLIDASGKATPLLP
jgi:arylsulfatase A-like enzyme